MPPLLLINGIGAALDLFEPLRVHLRERETIAFDAPGVGGSATPGHPLAMHTLAGIVSDLIAELGLERVDVLGLSWGGALAQELAYRHPHAVRRLVLAATMFGIGSVPGRPAAMSILATPARYYYPSYLQRIAPTLYGREILDHAKLLQRHAHLRAANPPSPVGYAWQVAAVSVWSSWPWLHRIRHRTLVLAGDDDPIIPFHNGEILARRIPRAQLHRVEGGGHLFLYLRAEEMGRVISAFCDQPSTRERRAERVDGARQPSRRRLRPLHEDVVGEERHRLDGGVASHEHGAPRLGQRDDDRIGR